MHVLFSQCRKREIVNRINHLEKVYQWHVRILIGCDVAHVEPERRAVWGNFLCNQPIDPFPQRIRNVVEYDKTTNQVIHFCSKLE